MRRKPVGEPRTRKPRPITEQTFVAEGPGLKSALGWGILGFFVGAALCGILAQDKESAWTFIFIPIGLLAGAAFGFFKAKKIAIEIRPAEDLLIYWEGSYSEKIRLSEIKYHAFSKAEHSSTNLGVGSVHETKYGFIAFLDAERRVVWKLEFPTVKPWKEFVRWVKATYPARGTGESMKSVAKRVARKRKKAEENANYPAWNCPHCEAPFRYRAEQAGTETTCPECEERLTLPHADVENPFEKPKKPPMKRPRNFRRRR